jgi:hypothetical protein
VEEDNASATHKTQAADGRALGQLENGGRGFGDQVFIAFEHGEGRKPLLETSFGRQRQVRRAMHCKQLFQTKQTKQTPMRAMYHE